MTTRYDNYYENVRHVQYVVTYSGQNILYNDEQFEIPYKDLETAMDMYTHLKNGAIIFDLKCIIKLEMWTSTEPNSTAITSVLLKQLVHKGATQ